MIKDPDYKLFSLLLLLSIGLMVMEGKQKIQTGKAMGRVAFYPFQEGIAISRDLLDLRSENDHMKTLVQKLSLENQLLKEFRYENESLRRMLAFKERGDFELLPSEVIGRSPGRMNQSLVIDRGKEDGVELNMPVVTYEGLVGKVIEVSSHTALVQTLFDRNSRVSALIQKTRGLGIIRWQGGTNLLLDNLPIQEKVETGDQIISSGLGGIFPKGLQIGAVREVREGRRGLFHEITVEPVVSSKIEEVFIILMELRNSSLQGEESKIEKNP